MPMVNSTLKQLSCKTHYNMPNPNELPWTMANVNRNSKHYAQCKQQGLCTMQSSYARPMPPKTKWPVQA